VREEFDLRYSSRGHHSSFALLINRMPNSDDGVFGCRFGGKLGGSKDALCHGAASLLVLPYFNPALREMAPRTVP